MIKINDFGINDSLYLCLINTENREIITIDFSINKSSTEIIINGKILNVNEIEKWIFFELIKALLVNNSVSTEFLLKPFKSLKSKVPVKKQLQKAIHNLRNEIINVLGLENEKKHELILTKRKTQFTEDTTYRFYIPEWEVKGYLEDINNTKNLLAFSKQLLSYNDDIYLKEITKAINKIVSLMKIAFRFYYPFLKDLETMLNSYNTIGLNPVEQIQVYIKIIKDLEENFISSTALLLNDPTYKRAKSFLGYYYGYNFATSGEEKISQNIQQIYIDKNNNLISKQISAEFKYLGNVKIEDNYLFTYAELVGENGFVQQVLNKPIVATTELKFLLGSFTAFSVDRSLCFGKRILIKIDTIIPLSECKTGYLVEKSREQLNNYFLTCFEDVNSNITRVKLPPQLDLDIKKLKVEKPKNIDVDWLIEA